MPLQYRLLAGFLDLRSDRQERVALIIRGMLPARCCLDPLIIRLKEFSMFSMLNVWNEPDTTGRAWQVTVTAIFSIVFVRTILVAKAAEIPGCTGIEIMWADGENSDTERVTFMFAQEPSKEQLVKINQILFG
jgi:hypothetical protein